MESTGKKKRSCESSTVMAPGFRFHPTDEELIRYYLRRKVCGKSLMVDAISDIDIYRFEPWDLPGMSKLRTGDLEWYFFSMLDRKYGNGARTNRATAKGYWKTTGKDRAVSHRAVIVGMKKTLVYHNGRAPKGQRSNWVMHEYRLADLELERAGISQDAFVLCRVFQKSGSGPKNGEQYGAPFVEEEWEDEEMESVPRNEASGEVDFCGDFCLDGHDLEQILGSKSLSHVTTLPLNFQSADGSHCDETKVSVSNTEKLSVGASEQFCEPEPFDGTNLYDLLVPGDMNVNLVRHEYIGESSKSGNPEDADYLFDGPFLDSSEFFPFGEEGFIETNDLSNPAEASKDDLDMLEEYLTYFDASDGNSQYLAYDPSLIPSENLVSAQTFRPQKALNEVTAQAAMPSGQITVASNVDAAFSSHKQVAAKYQSEDLQYPFIKQVSQMLSDIPAKPAFASEYPSKDSTLHFTFAHPSSSPMHVTASTIQIQNMTVGTRVMRHPLKHENLNIVVSFGFSHGDDGSANLESSVSIHPGKIFSTNWFYIFFGVLLVSTGLKIGSYLCAY